MLKAFLISTLLVGVVDFVTSASLSTKRTDDIFSVTVPVVTEPTDLAKTTTEEQPQKDEGFFNHEDNIVLMHQSAPNMVLPPPPMFDPRVPCVVPFVIGGPPNCQCIEKGRCSIDRMESTKFLLPKTDLVCGGEYEPCCFEDSPYPGKLDGYEIKCVPQEKCTRSYGQGPTDIAEFGIFPPCPGSGAVRCLDHLGVGPVPNVPIGPAVVIPPVLLPAVVQPNIVDDHELKCIPQEGCVRSYGQSPTDVAEFGTIPPCPEYGFVRCLDHLGVAPFVPQEMAPPPMPVFPSQPITAPPPAFPQPSFPVALPPPNLIPVTPQIHEPDVFQCVPVTMCTRSYGQSPTDVAEFGTFSPCPEFGFVRCLDHLGIGPVPQIIQEMAPPPPMPVFPGQTSAGIPPPFDPRVPCPVPYVIGGAPNCHCVEKGRCPDSRLEDTRILLTKVKLACGFEFEGCCYAESFYPGSYDDYSLQCIPQESCVRSYGQSPTDIADFGIFPPCPGYGAVRCLDHLGVGPYIIPQAYGGVPPPPPSQAMIPVPPPPPVQFHEPDNYILQCIPITMCTRRYYGQSPTDIAEFGTIPPCPEFGFVRCLDHLGVAPFIPAPAIPLGGVPQPPIQPVTDDYALQCVPGDVCARFYGQGVMDIDQYGTLPPCPEFGFVRCLDHLGVGPVPQVPQAMAPPPMPAFPALLQFPDFPIISLPPPQQQQPQQIPVIDQIPQLPPVIETPAQVQELAPPSPPRVYPYLGFRFPLVSTPYTSYGAPLGGVYGAPIPSRIGQYGFTGLTNYNYPLGGGSLFPRIF